MLTCLSCTCRVEAINHAGASLRVALVEETYVAGNSPSLPRPPVACLLLRRSPESASRASDIASLAGYRPLYPRVVSHQNSFITNNSWRHRVSRHEMSLSPLPAVSGLPLLHPSPLPRHLCLYSAVSTAREASSLPLPLSVLLASPSPPSGSFTWREARARLSVE